MARLPHWAKVAHNLDTHPKVRKAGNLGRQVFEYALRRNSDPSNSMGPGRVSLDYFEPRYLTEQLMLPAQKKAVEGLEAAIEARLLRRTSDAMELVGWEEEWGKGPLTEAERKAIQRAKLRTMSGQCPDAIVTGPDTSGQSRIKIKTERREEKEKEREKEREPAETGGLFDFSRNHDEAGPEPAWFGNPSPPAPAKGKARTKASQLPSDWQPAPYAIPSGVDVARELERFRNHALGAGRKQVDWQAAWRNWLLKAEEYASTAKGSARMEPKAPESYPDGEVAL